MLDLKKKEILGAQCYRLNTRPVTGYTNSEGGAIPAVPMIHTYSASMLTTSPKLAMTKPAGETPIQGKKYQVTRYLSVQALDDAFFHDEDGKFRPTVKPHYAIQPDNGEGSSYEEDCQTLLLENGKVLANRKTKVHVHDNQLSPGISLSSLESLLRTAQKHNNSLFIESYVVDGKKNHILVTQHCLLNDDDYNKLSTWLMKPENQNLKTLSKKPSLIQAAVLKFQNGTPDEQACFQTVFSGADRITYLNQQNKKEKTEGTLQKDPGPMAVMLKSKAKAKHKVSPISACAQSKKHSKSQPAYNPTIISPVNPGEHQIPDSYQTAVHPLTQDTGAKTSEPLDSSSASRKAAGVQASFLIKVLSISAVVVGLLALTGFAIGIGLAVGVSTMGVGLCAAGIAGAGLLTGFGIWASRKDKNRDSEPEKAFQPTCNLA